MVDPEYPRQGVPSPEGVRKTIIGKIFVENWMEMKEI